MVKTKRKSILRTLLCAVFALCFAVGLSSLFASGTTAYAATTPKYTLKVTGTKTDGTWGGEVTKNVTDATSVEVKKSLSDTENVSFYLNGTSVSGSGTLSSNSYITFSDVHISSSVSDCTITLYDNSERQVTSGTSSVSANLSDGRYKIRFTISRSGGGGYTKWSSNIDVYTYFYVDATAPTVSGASKSTNYYKTNTFTVSASDGGSGGATLYVKKPASSSYIAYGSSKTVNKTDTNGLYSFYAKDNVGNRSATYYVYLDSELPVGTIKNASGTTLTKEYTNGAFSYSATDSGSGINYLQYKKPSSTTWTSYTSGTSIFASSANGTYQFRAVDKAGNISATKSITLDSSKPTMTLYSETTSVSSGYKSTAKYIRAMAADSGSGVKTIYVKKPDASSYIEYTSGTQLTADGAYSFYCVDNAGNTSQTYTISMDHTKPTLTSSVGGFGKTLQDGFTVTASDNFSGVTLYYKTPNSASFVASTTSSVVFSKKAVNGTYAFYAVDGYGNKSDTYYMYMSIDAPEATIVKSDNSHKVCVIWTASNCTATLNGKSYISGTWIEQEGEYTFVITNDANRSTTYTVQVTHYYVKDSVVQATCTTQGYTIYRCTGCGDSYNAEYVNASGHDFSEWENLTEANCTSSGVAQRKCAVCLQTETKIVSPLGHDFKTEVIVATCLEQGYTMHTCLRCGTGYNDTFVPPLGHDYEEIEVAPNCTEEGYRGKQCRRCDDTIKTEILKAAGHTFTDSYFIATCEEEGFTLHTCLSCGNQYKDNIVPATGHDYETEVVREPRCETAGERKFHCARCGKEHYSDIPATGHNYELTGTEEVNGENIRTYVCTNCGTITTQNMGEQYEQVSSYIGYLFGQYQPYMWWVLLATAGVWSIVMGVFFAIAQKNEDKEKARKMIKNYVIGLVVIFAILVACPYLVKGIAALIAS